MIKKFVNNWVYPGIAVALIVSAGFNIAVGSYTIRGVKCHELGGRLDGGLITWVDSPCIRTTITTETLEIK